MLPVRAMNTSAIVDGYLVEAPGAPEWLSVDPSQVRLLPGSEEALPVKDASLFGCPGSGAGARDHLAHSIDEPGAGARRPARAGHRASGGRTCSP